VVRGKFTIPFLGEKKNDGKERCWGKKTSRRMLGQKKKEKG